MSLFRRRKAKRPRVRIIAVQDTEFHRRRYEISPETYEGPWKLEPGTVLEVVSTPAGTPEKE